MHAAGAVVKWNCGFSKARNRERLCRRVIEQGAYADLVLVNGNPLENLDLVADPGKNFAVIMKDGKIYKNAMK